MARASAAGWVPQFSFMESQGPSSLHMASPHDLSSRANRLLTWQLRAPRSKKQTLPGLLKASAKTVQPHFCHTLLVKASQRSGLNLRKGGHTMMRIPGGTIYWGLGEGTDITDYHTIYWNCQGRWILFAIPDLLLDLFVLVWSISQLENRCVTSHSNIATCWLWASHTDTWPLLPLPLLLIPAYPLTDSSKPLVFGLSPSLMSPIEHFGENCFRLPQPNISY